jgi:hypothetical protein
MKLITRASALIWILALAVITADIMRSMRRGPALTAEQAAALRMALEDAARDMVANQPPTAARDTLRLALDAIAESASVATARQLAALARRGRSALASLTHAASANRRDAANIADLLDRIDTLIAVHPQPNSLGRKRS